jgi:hypothetical protein
VGGARARPSFRVHAVAVIVVVAITEVAPARALWIWALDGARR